jgi:hypothetical protein
MRALNRARRGSNGSRRGSNGSRRGCTGGFALKIDDDGRDTVNPPHSELRKLLGRLVSHAAREFDSPVVHLGANRAWGDAGLAVELSENVVLELSVIFHRLLSSLYPITAVIIMLGAFVPCTLVIVPMMIAIVIALVRLTAAGPNHADQGNEEATFGNTFGGSHESTLT